jgi:hypothetical protein
MYWSNFEEGFDEESPFGTRAVRTVRLKAYQHSLHH